MTQRNTQGALNVDDMLDALDSLYKRHMNLINDMQGYVGNHETLQQNQKTDQDILTGAELDAFIKDIDSLLDTSKSSETFKPVTLEEFNQKYSDQLDLPDEPVEPDTLPLYLQPSASKPENGYKIQEYTMDDVKDIFSTLQNNIVSPGALPSFPDVSIFDSPEPKDGEETANKSSRPKSKVRNFISATLFYGLLICLIGSAFLFSQGNKKPVFGYSFMNVLTWSMQSEIPQGSMVVIKQLDPNTIQIGDDITYMKDADTSVTHRVIGITENFEGSGKRGFETQGIENDTPDFEIVPAVNVVGAVKFHIPMLGGWLEWLREHLIITLIFAAGFILLISLLKGAFKKNPEESEKHPSQSRQLQSAP